MKKEWVKPELKKLKVNDGKVKIKGNEYSVSDIVKNEESQKYNKFYLKRAIANFFGHYQSH